MRAPKDPFIIKSLPKWSPRRAVPTLCFRLQELYAKFRFWSYQLPFIPLPEQLALGPAAFVEDTAVTCDQRAVILACLRETEHLQAPCVEIGSYRGQTTKFIAEHSSRKVIAIDPFAGWGGCDEDYRCFLNTTQDLSNVEHWRTTSGQGVRRLQQISFAFIDAVHDYANTRFDIRAYAPKVVPNGILACHDTDNPSFAGTRRAVFEFLRGPGGFRLKYHVPDLVVMERL